MEHAALHGLQLIGLITALAGPCFVLLFLEPSRRSIGSVRSGVYGDALVKNAVRWTGLAALIGSLSAVADLVVQTAELDGRTIFGGVDPALVWQFATGTGVGRLCLTKAGLLLLSTVALRFPGRRRWILCGTFTLGASVASSLVSHAAAQPSGRAWGVSLQVLHLCGAAIWMGILLHLFSARRIVLSESDDRSVDLVAELIRRFSPWALAAVALLLLSGIAATCRFVGDAGALFASAYGLSLLVKLTVLSVALGAGWRNSRSIRPALAAACSSKQKVNPGRCPDAWDQPGRGPLLQRFRRYLELEITAGVLVIIIAGIVASVSPPGNADRQRLSDAQVRALGTPHLPRPSLPDPKEFVGAPQRLPSDLLYSEFMHNWSGVAVVLLGACWLLEAARGRLGRCASRLWPAVLVPFGLFIAYASDPEVWLLRSLSFRQILADPQMLEHQLGAVMVLLLAWLAWRDRHASAETSALGGPLTGIMIGGSLLLMGHAHSTLNTGDELASLINAQHAVLGGLGLLAGTVRWLGLRRLIPARTAAWVWPGLIISLGIFMAFFYREAI